METKPTAQEPAEKNKEKKGFLETGYNYATNAATKTYDAFNFVGKINDNSLPDNQKNPNSASVQEPVAPKSTPAPAKKPEPKSISTSTPTSAPAAKKPEPKSIPKSTPELAKEPAEKNKEKKGFFERGYNYATNAATKTYDALNFVGRINDNSLPDNQKNPNSASVQEPVAPKSTPAPAKKPEPKSIPTSTPTSAPAAKKPEPKSIPTSAPAAKEPAAPYNQSVHTATTQATTKQAAPASNSTHRFVSLNEEIINIQKNNGRDAASAFKQEVFKVMQEKGLVPKGDDIRKIPEYMAGTTVIQTSRALSKEELEEIVTTAKQKQNLNNTQDKTVKTEEPIEQKTHKAPSVAIPRDIGKEIRQDRLERMKKLLSGKFTEAMSGSKRKELLALKKSMPEKKTMSFQNLKNQLKANLPGGVAYSTSTPQRNNSKSSAVRGR